MDLTERIVTGAKAMLAAQVVRMASKGIVVLLLTRVFLTPTEYGTLSLALAVLGFCTLFASLGLAKSAARYVAEYGETDPGQVPHILWTTLKFNAVTIAVVASVLVVFGDRLAAFLGEPGLAVFLLVGAGYIVTSSLGTYARLLFQGLGKVTYSAWVNIVGELGVLVGVVGFLFLGGGALGALYGYIVGSAVAVVVGFVLLYLTVTRRYDQPRNADEDLPRRILGYSLPLAATRGANILDKRVDTILVGFFLSPLAVGYYVLAKQVSSFAVAPAMSLGFSVAPAYGEYQAAEQLESAARLYERTFTYTLLLYLPASVGLLLVADPLVRVVFGTGYLGAIPVLQLFSVYVLLQAVDKITNDSLDYLGRARVRAVAKGTMSVANFLLNLVAIPLFGVTGAAGATVLTYSGLVAVELIVVGRDLPISSATLARKSAVIGGVALGLGVVVMALAPFVGGIPTLVAVVLVGAGVWTVLSLLTGLLDLQELQKTLL
jgi:O-antigen/teichoic acid export membrane protein